ncbi:sugar ABC transporter substrate-binding protein [Nonomuraea roseoviolacea]|uniref:Multiple sugar transport system substrate-binding protein n=1 Tax=Nonomuraea roseoviolacea subsp. carminata TaxID=160689 RepID=A0ABT1KEH4_9ACTN|nr:extracellular solute-binding protein [Nonomuraea roseoviolacea]MCP2352412.1 multiple sugar transport system substrate-binding protein [Nonomuraea roseoviolacea subsp. carminata]
MSRTIAGVTVTAALLAGLTACGGGGMDAAEGRTLTYWTYQDRTPQAGQVIEKIRKDFEKTNPGVSVKIVKIPKDDYNTKLGSAVAAKTAPDAGVLDQPLVSKYALDGTIKEVPAGLFPDGTYFKGALDTNLGSDGKYYGLPVDQIGVALFYNKKLVPSPPRTWDELKQVAAQVHQAHPDVAGMVVPKGDGYGAWMFPGVVAGAGGEMADVPGKKILFDQPPAVEALQLWADLLPSSPRKITDSDKPFENGLAAMQISGPWDVPTIREQFPDLDFSVAPLPYKTAPAGNIGGENSVVFSTTKNADLAWKWLLFLGNAANNGAVADAAGGFPVNTRATPVGTGPENEAFLAQLKVAHARPAMPQWIQINDEIIAPAIESALSGKATPRQALTDAAAKTRALLGWNG